MQVARSLEQARTAAEEDGNLVDEHLVHEIRLEILLADVRAAGEGDVRAPGMSGVSPLEISWHQGRCTMRFDTLAVRVQAIYPR